MGIDHTKLTYATADGTSADGRVRNVIHDIIA
jgi:hypothetical protein